jgi:membrane fusion protein, copper/silver efflux system
MPRIFLAVCALWLVGCAMTPAASSPAADPANSHAAESASGNASPLSLDSPATAPMAVAMYVCPMHASVVSDHPGKCPICGMALVPKVSAK